MASDVPPTETLPPDGYLQPRRYRIHAECGRCGHQFSWVTTKLDGKDRPCPVKACREGAMEEEINRRAENLARMLAEQRPPAHIGANQTVKNIDRTAQIVMEDNHMTDLKDNVREGDIVAPNLPTYGQSGMSMSQIAENFFSPKALKDTPASRQAALLGQQAIAGMFADSAARPGVLQRGVRQGSAPLTLVKTEKLGG